MSKETDARKSLLATQVEHAVVEALEDGYYSVFVPNAVREYNVVTADDEADAKKRVLEHLSVKIDQIATEQVYTGTDEPQEGEVSVDPDNLKVKMKATVKVGEN